LRYVSTRSVDPATESLSFEDVLLAGLARDGGLYVPDALPRLTSEDLRRMQGMSYVDLAVAVMLPFIDGAMAEGAFRRLVADSYAGFGHPATAPLKQLGRHDWLMELFHGPTLAFKDYPLQFVGRLFDHVLAKRQQRVTIVGATSGDTGSAAIEACRDREAVDIFILYPHGRVSEVQRRQMTSVASSNVHTIAIEGTFDDCQDLVKAMFADHAFRDRLALSAVNSINWGRILAQVVYYFAAALALGAPDRRVAFAVPTGNFGNVFAGHVARMMGLPVAQLVVATNRNDILARFLHTGRMTMTTVEPSLSPSMDIQVSSNFERLLYELKGRSGAAVADAIRVFRSTGTLPTSPAEWQNAKAQFEGFRADDELTTAIIGQVLRETGELLDPHSAIAVAGMRGAAREPGVPMVALACAHPAKFPDAVEAACGRRPVPNVSIFYPTILPRFSVMWRTARASRMPHD
jgi:threonine synthase